MLLGALERGRDRVLIFEDDVVLRDDADDWMAKILPQLQAIDWDIFYLGLHLEIAGPAMGANLREVRRGFHTHAYAVARKAMARVAAHIDRVVEDMAGTFDGFEDPTLVKVCAMPILAVQEPNFSSTFGQRIDRLGQYFTAFDGADFRAHCQEMAAWRARSA
jgi:GR25 family glycosyltransferase involved in LPS biosynthesis